MAVNCYIFEKSKWGVYFDGPPLNTDGRKTVEDWAKTVSSDFIFNLGLFDMTPGRLSSKGKACSYVHSSLKGDLAYGYEGISDVLELPNGNKCCGYSNGIKDGKIFVNNPFKGSRTRNGIGITDNGDVIIAQSGTSITESSFCAAVLNYCKAKKANVKLFVLADGGGSTSMYSSASRLGFHPEGVRTVATITYVTCFTKLKIERNLRLGSVGDDVRLLQMVLGGIATDGIFGPATRKRLIEAQKALGIKADGKCGPITKAALFLD